MKSKFMLRKLMTGDVRQSIENGMLCLTDLGKIYEKERLKNGWVEKDMSLFFNNKSEKEYIFEILELQGYFVKHNKLSFMEIATKQGFLKALKWLEVYQTKGRAENKAVFVNPYIFVGVAQWLNPRFRAYVTIWVTDQLILNRIEAGERYNDLCKAISEYILPNLESENAKKFIYSNFAKLVNKKVFGEHKDDLRQIASKEDLRKLKDLEIEMITLIKVGYISNYQDAKNYLQ